ACGGARPWRPVFLQRRVQEPYRCASATLHRKILSRPATAAAPPASAYRRPCLHILFSAGSTRPLPSLPRYLRQFFGLIFGDERVDDLVQAFARHDPVELIKRQVDAMIRHAALRKVIGADAFRPVA